MKGPAGVPFVYVTRGDYVESVHAVAAHACDSRGNTLLSIGDVETPVYLRSASKPLITAAILRAGASGRFSFEPQEIAVMAASHSGEPFHIAAVRSILSKIGLGEDALRCGVHVPFNEGAAETLRREGHAPTAVYNNCSGKHAGILALCVMQNADVESYRDRDHPAQREIIEFCARLTGDDANTIPLAVDGCGIPVFATSLRRAARAFALFADLERVPGDDARALGIVRDAMLAYPEYVAGTGEFDSILMRTERPRIVCKAGAEGIHASALLALHGGLALKVIDGAKRAVAPAAMRCLGELGALHEPLAPELRRFVRTPVANRAGDVVGEIGTEAGLHFSFSN